MPPKTLSDRRRAIMGAFFYLLFGTIVAGVLLLAEKGVVLFGWQPITWSPLTWTFFILFLAFWCVTIYLGMDYVIDKWINRWETKLDEQRARMLRKLAEIEQRMKTRQDTPNDNGGAT